MRIGILILLWGLVSWAEADIYHYVDASGRKVFVDSLSQVPEQYLDQLQTRAEARPAALPEAAEKDASIQEIRQQLDDMLEGLDKAIAKLETSVLIRGNQVIVPVRAVYGNRRADTRLLLDTGASGTLFHRQALSPLRGATYDSGSAQIANGEVIDVQAINLDRLEIGPFKTKSTRAMVIDPVGSSRHDGLLGMDFLRQVEYRIDYDNDLLIWRPQRHKELMEQRERIREQQAMSDEDLIASLRAEAPEQKAAAEATGNVLETAP